MNIKIVYNKKLHKLQTGLKNLLEIRTAIKKLYPTKLPEGFKLLALQDPQTQELILIDNDENLQNIMNLYQKNNWPSLKILVQDTLEQINFSDLDLLNQSMVQLIKKNQQEELIQVKHNATNQTQTMVEVKDQSISNIPVQFDQSQQFYPESQHKECQSSVQTKDNGQNPRRLEEKILQVPCFSCIGRFDNCLNCGGTRVHPDNDKLIQFFTQLIDQRLQFYHLIQVQQQDQVQELVQQEKRDIEQEKKEINKQEIVQLPYKKLEQPVVCVKSISKSQLELKENEEFETEITVRNNGKYAWPKYVELKCLHDLYKNFSQTIDISLEPAQEWVFKLKLHAPQQLGNSQYEFRVLVVFDDYFYQLCFIENDELKYFGQTIFLSLNVIKEEKVNKNISCNQEAVKTNQVVLEQAREMLKLFPDRNLKDIVSFIQMFEVNVSLEELIIAYLQCN